MSIKINRKVSSIHLNHIDQEIKSSLNAKMISTVPLIEKIYSNKFPLK